MRKITEEVIRYFFAGQCKKLGNTEIFCDREGLKMFLHNNLIAIKKHDDNKLKIRLAGWNTVTTRERLNGLPGVNLTQKNFEPYLNGVKINAWDWYEIN